VSISFNEGGIHALVGENGAGKSTLIKIISGAIKPDEGKIRFGGKAHSFMTPAISTGLGIGVIYQEFNLVPSLTILENVFLGQKVGGKVMPDFKKMKKRSLELFADLGIDIDVERMVGELSVSKQQLVEIAKAVALDTKLLIMDEPSAAIAQAEVENMMKIVLRLKEKGVTIIYISHRMNEIFSIADTVTVLRDGRHISSQPIGDVTRKDLINLMVGRELSESFPQRQIEHGEVVLEVKGMSGNGNADINFFLRKGEILGFAGLVGAGRTELAKVLFGAAPLEVGVVTVKGKDRRIRNPRQAVFHGIGLIPEDRKSEGGFQDYSILWNVSIMSLHRMSKFSVISRPKERELSNYYASLLKIKTPSYDQLLKNLSGGNQQKVVLAKVLAAQTDIIIFDEPTRGIDVGAKQEIYRLMNELTEQGISIIMISSEMEELMGMSDRIMVMCEGRITGTLEKEDFDQKRILELASNMQ
ncbi:MAG: sugar ABC transporter ATP-binding protein, partial [Clostridiales bacterium]|nr:sugar ABC transporter ATP-binding protein [Clostridiales bacterium]